MHYEEKVIDGATMYRTTPEGNWFEVSNRVLTERIMDLRIDLIEILEAEERYDD